MNRRSFLSRCLGGIGVAIGLPLAVKAETPTDIPGGIIINPNFNKQGPEWSTTGIRWRRYSQLPASIKPLEEGIVPDPITLRQACINNIKKKCHYVVDKRSGIKYVQVTSRKDKPFVWDYQG